MINNLNDISKAITAEDLIRRYNLDNLKTDRKNISKVQNTLIKQNTLARDFIVYITPYKIDNDLIVWFFNGPPSLENEPYTDFVDDADNHLGDLYYDRDNGTIYQFIREDDFEWKLIEDINLLKVIALANADPDTYDNKRKIFYEIPHTPYEIGDMWLDNNIIMRCRCSRADGDYKLSDWIVQDSYSNDYVLGEAKAVLDSLKITIEKDYVKTTQLETTKDNILASVNEKTTEIITTATEKYEYYDEAISKINIDIGKIVLENSEIKTSLGEIVTDYTTKIELTTNTINQSISDNVNNLRSSFLQAVDELNIKIQKIADITVSEASLKAKIELNSINSSEPISIIVYPIIEDISYLYPHKKLYPNEGLFLKIRILRFYNKTTKKNIDYVLPGDLLYFDSNIYDEFRLDYETKSCIITKKVEFDEEGNKVLLEEPKIVPYQDPYPTISLTDGDYEILLLKYDNGYLSVRLMGSNIYTAQYATKVELNSSVVQTTEIIESKVNAVTSSLNKEVSNLSSRITQTAKNITIEVSENYVGKAAIISQINQSAEKIQILASKIDLKGYITATDLSGAGKTTINGSNITTGTINADLIKSGTINGNNVKVTNISASNITGGTMSANRISGGTLSGTTISGNTIKGGTIAIGDNFSVNSSGNMQANNATITGKITATSGTIGGCSISDGVLKIGNTNITSLNAGKISGGTINGKNVEITNLDASNITSGSMSAARISGGTISTSNLTCGNYVKIYSGGHLELTNAAGFFAMGPAHGSVPNIVHPYVSALNICRGNGVGVTFRSSEVITSTGSSVGYIRCYQDSSRGATNQMNIYANDGVEIASSSGGNIYLWSKIELNANGAASVWAKGNNLSSGRVQTSEGQASSRILKEKITPFKSQDYDEAYQLLKSIDICSYDYKYKLYKDKHQYGFIIDDLEALPNYDKFFKLETLYAKVSENGTIDPSIMDDGNFDKENLGKDIIEYKEYDSNVLDKYLLTCLKALQQKVDFLEKRLRKEE